MSEIANARKYNFRAINIDNSFTFCAKLIADFGSKNYTIVLFFLQKTA
jgi:hypothetical protein